MQADEMLDKAVKLPVAGACQECRHLVPSDHPHFHRCGRKGFQYVELVNHDGNCPVWAPAPSDRQLPDSRIALPQNTEHRMVLGFVGALLGTCALLALFFWVLNNVPAASTYYRCSEEAKQRVKDTCGESWERTACRNAAHQTECEPIRAFEYAGPGNGPIPCEQARTRREKRVCGQGGQ